MNTYLDLPELLLLLALPCSVLLAVGISARRHRRRGFPWTVAQINGAQAAIVVGTELFLLALTQLLGRARRPDAMLWLGMLLAIPVALIEMASRIDRATHRTVTVVVCTIGWIVVAWLVILVRWFLGDGWGLH